MSQYKVFISHSSADTWVAERIKEDMEKKGTNVFLDAHDLRGGDPFDKRIFDEIKSADEFVVLMTEKVLQSPGWYIPGEVAVAYANEKVIILITYGVLPADIQTHPQIFTFVKGLQLRDLNQEFTGKYLPELEERIQQKQS